ncbi:NADPH--cytochrome P450 reductase isoform X1 [Aix galericulata]|nr:NADPH--cytochrome P450 reductase isoform X1 [Aix galericulata]
MDELNEGFGASLIAMGDAGMDAPPAGAVQQDSFFSMTDVFLISLITGLFTYWFFFRKKKEEIPELPKIQTAARGERNGEACPRVPAEELS